MTTAALLLLFIVALTFRSAISKKDFQKPLYFRYRKIIALFAITMIPMVYMNIFHYEPKKLNPDEYLEHLIEHGEKNYLDHFFIKEEAFQTVMDLHPDSVTIRFDYIEHVIDYPHFDRESLRDMSFSSNDIIQAQSLAYLKAQHFYNDPNWRDVKTKTEGVVRRYDNLIWGLEAHNNGLPDKAKEYFLKEIELNPNFDRAYLELFALCRYNFPKEFKKYSLTPKYASHLPYSIQRYNYFMHNDIGNYFITITKHTFADILPIAFISALLIVILWLTFLRSMDVFNKEKWVDILIVFILGGLFTNLCLYNYDYFHYAHGFGIMNQVWNDFWYCVIVIGGGEELVKFVPWVAFIFLARKAKEPYDYILYASVSALGFSFVENFQYLENSGNIVIRSIMSSVGHMFFASIVAYTFILARYKATTRAMKILWPIIGFALACLCHGFYDFWLISPAVHGWSILTMVFFILSLYVWILMINNAINHSPFYKKSSFDSDVQLNLLTFGIIGLMMFEYVIIAYKFGAESANDRIGGQGWKVVIFLSFMTAVLAKIKIIPGRWKKYKFALPTSLGSYFNFFSVPGSKNAIEEESYLGLHLKLFVKKSNRYVADKFPVSGRCIENITISGHDGWYLFQLNSPINYAGFKKDLVIVRVKTKGEKLYDDKVEIILLFIPVGTYLDGALLKVEDLRFTGAVFARPN